MVCFPMQMYQEPFIYEISDSIFNPLTHENCNLQNEMVSTKYIYDIITSYKTNNTRIRKFCFPYK